MLQFDGMKSNFEIEEEQKTLHRALSRHRFIDSQSLYHGNMSPTTNVSELSDVNGVTPIDVHYGRQMSLRMDMDDYDLASVYNEPPFSSLPPCVLVVYLATAKNIPHLDAWQIPNLYVTFHYGNGKEQQSVITSNSDDNDDPIWNEYAAIPLSTELLVSSDNYEQKLTLKFWDYSPIHR